MKAISKPLSEYEPRTIDWLWNLRIPYGCLTLIEGDGGTGKSFVVASIVSHLTTGRALPDDIVKEKSSFLLLSAEDDPHVVIRPRVEASGGDLNLIRICDVSIYLNKDGLELLENEIKEFNIKAVFIDPIMAYIEGRTDTSKANDVRGFMKPLHEIAQRNNCAIVIVRHWNKSNGAASQRGSGSVDFRNAARSVLQVIRLPDETSYITLEKSNYAANGKTLTFAIDDKKLNWTGTSELTANQLCAETQLQGSDLSELDAAIEFITDMLKNGPVKAKEFNIAATEVGLSSSTLKRAKKKLVVKSFKKVGSNEFLVGFDTPDQGQKQGCGPSLEVPKHDPHPDLSEHNTFFDEFFKTTYGESDDKP